MRALLLLLAACGGKANETALPPTSSDTDTDTDSDADSDTDTDSDTDADTDSDTDAPAYDCTADQTALRSGVAALDLGGSLPSALVVHGERACPVLVDGNGRTWVATGQLGGGRAVEFGHEGWLFGPDGSSGDADALLENALLWAAATDAPRVGVELGYTSVFGWLEDHGMTGVALATANVTAEDLADVDVLITDVYTDRSDDAVDALHAWVSAGGGLVVGGHAWYWGSGYAEPALDYPGNRLLNDLGVTVTVDTAASGASTVTDPPPSPLYHAARALEALADHVDGVATLSEDDVAIAADTAVFAAANLPVVFGGWWDPAREFLAAIPAVIPTAADPVVPDDAPIDALAVALEGRLALEAPADEINVVAAASDFPGAVDAGAARISRTLTVDATWAGRDPDYAYSGAQANLWLSTGLYAAPGEAITLTVPGDWAGQGLQLQIGSHADTLWHLASWPRHPEVVRRDPVDAPTTTAASGFGGLIYLTVPVGAALDSGEITVDGGVAAPSYVHGVTDPSDFASALAAGEAPWAELATDGIVHTLPTDELAVSDPTAVMAVWSEIMDAAQALAGEPGPRVRDERIVLDREISAGWMHSGYPAMGHLDSTTELSDVDWMLSASAWGPLHELGHNHQLDPANLPGVTEATCNLWSVYLSEQVLGVDRAVAHSALTPDSRAATVSAYLATGPDFWGAWNVWTALETYLQLQERFGWDPIIAVHSQYVAMDPASRPGNDQDRIDEWAIRTSLAAGRDLTDFYTAWGWPLSKRVAAEVSGLPPWLDHPLAD